MTDISSLKTQTEGLLDEARQFAQTVQDARALFPRESAFRGLQFVAEQARENMNQMRTAFLDSDSTLVEPKELHNYSEFENFCVDAEQVLSTLLRKSSEVAYFRRRRLIAGSAIAVIATSLISWTIWIASTTPHSHSAASKQTDKERVTSRYIKAQSGDRLSTASGDSFDVYSGGLVTAEEGSSGTAHEGGVAVVKDGASITALTGSTVYVYKGGTVIVKPGSDVFAAAGAIVQKEDGAKVIFKEPGDWPNTVR